MVRALHKLSDAAAKSDRLKPGRHSDGGGLYLNVGPAGTKSWLFMWVPPGGKRKEMGLGAYPIVTLAKARAKASDCRQAVSEGRDPIAEKKREAEPTFGECADRSSTASNPNGGTPSTVAVGNHARRRVLLDDPRQAGFANHHRRRSGRSQSDLAEQGGNGVSHSRADRACSRLRQGEGLALRREPGRLAWSSAQHSPQARQADARPSRRDALREPAGLRRTHSGGGRNGGSRA